MILICSTTAFGSSERFSGFFSSTGPAAPSFFPFGAFTFGAFVAGSAVAAAGAAASAGAAPSAGLGATAVGSLVAGAAASGAGLFVFFGSAIGIPLKRLT